MTPRLNRSAAAAARRTAAVLATLTSAITAAALLPACTTQTAYLTVMEMRKQECRKLPDIAEQTRCLREADRSYDRYKSEAEGARRAP